MWLIRSVWKNFRLARIMKRISPPRAQRLGVDHLVREVVAQAVAGGNSDKHKAVEDLFRLVLNDRDLSAIMRMHGATETTIRDAYRNLVLCGAGQWVNGAYVAAAAIATNPSLDYILSELARGDPADPRDYWPRISAEMVNYFSR